MPFPHCACLEMRLRNRLNLYVTKRQIRSHSLYGMLHAGYAVYVHTPNVECCRPNATLNAYFERLLQRVSFA